MDLQETPLENAELVLITDGFYLKDKTGHYQGGYAIVSLNETVEVSPMPQETTVEKAELSAEA